MTAARLTSFLGGSFKLSRTFRDWESSCQRNSHSSFDFSTQKTLCKFESWNAGCKQWWVLGTEKASEIGPQLWSRHRTDLQTPPDSDVGRAGSERYRWSPVLARSKLFFLFFQSELHLLRSPHTPTSGCFKMGIKFSCVTEHWGGIQKLRRSLLGILGQVASSFASTQTTTNSYTHIHSSDSPCAVTPNRI